jgi:hypothetical protein
MSKALNLQLYSVHKRFWFCPTQCLPTTSPCHPLKPSKFKISQLPFLMSSYWALFSPAFTRDPQLAYFGDFNSNPAGKYVARAAGRNGSGAEQRSSVREEQLNGYRALCVEGIEVTFFTLNEALYLTCDGYACHLLVLVRKRKLACRSIQRNSGVPTLVVKCVMQVHKKNFPKAAAK